MFRFFGGGVLGIISGLSNDLFVITVDSLFARLTQTAPAPIQSIVFSAKAVWRLLPQPAVKLSLARAKTSSSAKISFLNLAISR